MAKDKAKRQPEPIEVALQRAFGGRDPKDPTIPDDMVARRIVMRRELWDELVKLAERVKAERGIEVGGCDVAALAIELGLSEVKQG